VDFGRRGHRAVSGTFESRGDGLPTGIQTLVRIEQNAERGDVALHQADRYAFKQAGLPSIRLDHIDLAKLPLAANGLDHMLVAGPLDHQHCLAGHGSTHLNVIARHDFEVLFLEDRRGDTVAQLR